MQYQIINNLDREYLEKIKDRFWDGFTLPAGLLGCWEWGGSVGTNGYARFSVDTIWKSAHRVSYELNVGPIPAGLNVCHRCDNPICVNPYHLFIGTDKDNTDDMIKKGRAAPADGENNGHSKLTAQQVREIRKKYKRFKYGYKKLGQEYGVHLSTIHLIVTRQSWTNNI